MTKLTAAFVTLFFSLTVVAYEVPEPLKNLLKNQKERIFIGQEPGGGSCELKMYENRQGFFMDAYERDHAGEINQEDQFGRFTLNDDHKLEDFWQYTYGFSVITHYSSDFGASFDRKSFVRIEEELPGKIQINIDFKRSNGFFLYTFYKFNCIVDF